MELEPHFALGYSLGVVRELLRTEAKADRQLDAQAILSRISLWVVKLFTQFQVGDYRPW